jgi:pilus assembly protein CpaC
VGLSFTPTVIGKDAINLKLDAEVSAIDPTVSVVLDSIKIPGLKTRKSSTTVELLDGQSFAIAGLIEDNFDDTIRTVSGLHNIPIIGALARSTDFLRRQTELVVIIEAHLVQPAIARNLSSPTDTALPPSDYNLFMMGEAEQGAVLNKAAGIDGPYGYILP